MRPIKKILIANRGEIAIRIMRTCRELDIETVAVYSEADRTSLHVRYAHEAYYIGKAQSSESYLNFDKIVEVAKKANVDAIHPGYGFLSENSLFAKRCMEEGIIFIGPTPEVIVQMGDKIQAREAMKKAGIPVVPGTENSIQTEEEVLNVIKEIGLPRGRPSPLILDLELAEEKECVWYKMKHKRFRQSGLPVLKQKRHLVMIQFILKNTLIHLITSNFKF